MQETSSKHQVDVAAQLKATQERLVASGWARCSPPRALSLPTSSTPCSPSMTMSPYLPHGQGRCGSRCLSSACEPRIRRCAWRPAVVRRHSQCRAPSPPGGAQSYQRPPAGLSCLPVFRCRCRGGEVYPLRPGADSPHDLLLGQRPKTRSAISAPLTGAEMARMLTSTAFSATRVCGKHSRTRLLGVRTT